MGLSLLVSIACGITKATGRQQPVILWPDGAPGAVGSEPADIPSMVPYLPARRSPNRAAIIVCPGGAYGSLFEGEGAPVAEWLTSLGVTAFVLHYRTAPRYHHPAPLQDAERAVRIVRARAKDWGLDPERIGVLGFSAGGHLASSIGTHNDSGRPDASDPIERVSSRPDLMILIYPVITMGAQTHAGSRENLLGPSPSPHAIALLSNEAHVTNGTPPTFLVHGVNDAAVPVENSLLFAAALRTAGVPFELHLYERGRHGFALGRGDPALSSWTERCADWLRLRGFIR